MTEVTQISRMAASSYVGKVHNGVSSPAITDCHWSRDDEKGRL